MLIVDMIAVWWKNLSVSKKLYSVVGLMAVLIAAELLTLFFAMNTLSAVRALVHGEGMWSKAQKDAIQSLQKYVITGEARFFDHFNEQIKVPLGDRQARLELEKKNFDYERVKEGFIAGRVHPEDVKSIVQLLRRFHKVKYVEQAIFHWRDGDNLMTELTAMSLRIQNQISNQPRLSSAQLVVVLEEISNINTRFTKMEDSFTTSLGDASRWLENVLMLGLILAVITIEGLGLTLTISFTNGLSRTLKELAEVARKVGSGDFTSRVPVYSKDELGQLAESINAMSSNLRHEASQRHQAEQASHAKNLFLANMSHEIRTPLNAIMGFSDLLRETKISEQEKNQYLDIIKRTGRNLATIINDILDVTKIEAEQMKIEKLNFSLPLLLKDLEILLRLRADEKGLQFSIHSKEDVPELICSDPVRLRQILINIIGNAIKYTDQGSVDVTYQVSQNQLIFEVADTGNGIAENNLNKLFKPFSQGDNSSQKRFSGTGLGLILSKKLAHLLGGDVELIKSEIGTGSVFRVSIQYVPVEKDMNIDYSDKKSLSFVNFDKTMMEGKKILVVEDTLDSQFLLKLYLTKNGALVDIASNGEEGVKKALEQEYSLILMDMQMPIMDGYTATQFLRKNGSQVPIVALTAYAMQGDRDKTIQAGCNDYLTKPIDKDQLFNVVGRFLH